MVWAYVTFRISQVDEVRLDDERCDLLRPR
jgi:hypothetical protein